MIWDFLDIMVKSVGILLVKKMKDLLRLKNLLLWKRECIIMEEGVYVLEKKYWVYLKSDDFCRWLWRLCDWIG